MSSRYELKRIRTTGTSYLFHFIIISHHLYVIPFGSFRYNYSLYIVNTYVCKIVCQHSACILISLSGFSNEDQLLINFKSKYPRISVIN